MTWRKAVVGADGSDRYNRLTCDGTIGYGKNTEGKVVPIPCQKQITLVATAKQARRLARELLWETATVNGDRCPEHRLSRPRR